MHPLKHYLIRAVHDWAVDSGFTPQVVVAAAADGVKVPAGYTENGRIVINIHPRAVNRLEFASDAISFSARFGAQSSVVIVPYHAVLAIYARENGQGISLPDTLTGEIPQSGPAEPPPDGGPGKGPTLRVVK